MIHTAVPTTELCPVDYPIMSENRSTADISCPETASPQNTSIGLDRNIAGALSYLTVIGLVFYFIEKECVSVPFHATKSISHKLV